MLHAKQASKRKRRSKAVPVLGAAGLLSLAGGAASTQAAGPAADIAARHIEPSHELTLSEEEVSDVSLATFYVFDKEIARPLLQLTRCGGCGGGCGRGCGCGGGCRCGGGGCRCGGGCGCFRGCVGCGGCGSCGGCGCCLSWGACALC
jgi:hypothetical protein